MQPYGSSRMTDLLVLKISPALKGRLIAEAERRELSLSDIARQCLAAGLAAQQNLSREVQHA